MDRVSSNDNNNYSHSDSPSAAQYPQHHHPQHHQDIRAAPSSYASSGTPNTEYTSATPSSARSPTFPQDYLSRQHYTPGSASMAQAQSPSTTNSLARDGNIENNQSMHMSNNSLTIDPSIAASSPTYPGPFSPYGPQGHDMGQHAGHYPPAYPSWPGYGAHPHMQYNSPPSASSTPTTGPPRPGQQVYSFVPIPGAQQTKRPRRRYEEIERMYKCGHENCEKAYGTLNHLNAHVTMQGHGNKRTPEEFKEIRKEWKQRKKEEEASRKGDSNDGRRVDSGPEAQLTGAVSSPDSAPTPTSQSYPSRPQLPPPLGYTTGNSNGNGTSYQSPDPIYQNGNTQVYSTYPHAPYSSSTQVYQR